MYDFNSSFMNPNVPKFKRIHHAMEALPMSLCFRDMYYNTKYEIHDMSQFRRSSDL